VAAFSLPAQAQSCAERNAIIDGIKEKYGETPVAVGVTNGGGLVEVLASKDGETWTIIITTPQGMSCPVAAGEGWRAIDRSAVDPET